MCKTKLPRQLACVKCDNNADGLYAGYSLCNSCAEQIIREYFIKEKRLNKIVEQLKDEIKKLENNNKLFLNEILKNGGNNNG